MLHFEWRFRHCHIVMFLKASTKKTLALLVDHRNNKGTKCVHESLVGSFLIGHSLLSAGHPKKIAKGILQQNDFFLGEVAFSYHFLQQHFNKASSSCQKQLAYLHMTRLHTVDTQHVGHVFFFECSIVSIGSEFRASKILYRKG